MKERKRQRDGERQIERGLTATYRVMSGTRLLVFGQDWSARFARLV